MRVEDVQKTIGEAPQEEEGRDCLILASAFNIHQMEGHTQCARQERLLKSKTNTLSDGLVVDSDLSLVQTHLANSCDPAGEVKMRDGATEQAENQISVLQRIADQEAFGIDREDGLNYPVDLPRVLIS